MSECANISRAAVALMYMDDVNPPVETTADALHLL